MSQICASCGKPVSSSRKNYELFEHMHWICFHFEFEHGDHDRDQPCDDPSCLWNRLGNDEIIEIANIPSENTVDSVAEPVAVELRDISQYKPVPGMIEVDVFPDKVVKVAADIGYFDASRSAGSVLCLLSEEDGKIVPLDFSDTGQLEEKRLLTNVEKLKEFKVEDFKKDDE